MTLSPPDDTMDQPHQQYRGLGQGARELDAVLVENVVDNAFPLANLRFFRLWRFLDAIEGFHLGNLDLNGRHKSRYEALEKRWLSFNTNFDSFLSEQMALGLSADLADRRLAVSDSDDQTPSHFRESPAFAAFRNDWRLPYFDDSRLDKIYLKLIRRVGDVRTVVLDHPQPIFQRLCLLSLPDELLDKILCSFETGWGGRHTSDLPKTCRRLRRIGWPLVFKSFRLYIPQDPVLEDVCYHADWSPSEDPNASLYLSRAAEAVRRCQSSALNSVEFLLRSSELLGHLSEIWVQDHYEMYWPSHVPFIPFAPTFYGDLRILLKSLLSGAPRLRGVNFKGLEPDLEMYHLLSRVSTLHSLCIEDCELPADLRQGDSFMASNHTVRDLRLRSRPFSAWNLLALYPHVENLYISTVPWTSILPCPEVLRASHNPFDKLRRISLTGLSVEALQSILYWMAAAFQLHLTSFLAILSSPVDGTTLVGLIAELRRGRAPLRRLLLDGIANEEMQLVQAINSNFTELVDLFLGMRVTESQGRSELCVWPKPTYEYAPLLAPFRCLRRFGWNNYTDDERYSPILITAFETGFAERTSSPHIEDADELSNGRLDGIFESVVSPFAAYCPSLRTFFTWSSMANEACNVTPGIGDRLPKLERAPYHSHKLEDVLD